ncbi:RETARDED ROOT GROWTH [Hibiscus trionum]|uniref:RETARDED ROOT GROWTH n=1 Tax=Hibiscus trionum TaxID=183268 RepID=A0A9W7I5C8_HIBTR|nr:RETARDED ROOT GROWTH [Hibiscus trionum]
MGRWRAAASILMNHLNKNPFPSHKFRSPKPLFRSPSLNPIPRFLFTKHFSALPSRIPVYTSDFDHGSPEFSHQNHGFVSQEEEEEELGKIPIKAYFLCTSIDLKSMQAENLSNVIPPSSRSSNYIALRFCDFPPDITALGMRNKASGCRYMVVFQYGSAVLFNIEDHEVERHLEMVRRHASGLLTEMRKDDYTVKEQPLLTQDMQGGPDYIVLKTLDTDSIRIIGSVLGQSIALDYFVSQVDGMVEGFADINRAMEKTGTFTMDRTSLIKLVGKANSNLADVILKVGLFERSEIAWREAKYAQIYEYLREEYEVTQRFGNLDFKLKFVEHNIRFLQEVIQNRRSDLLEWCIIFLLTIENVIAIYEIVRESTGVSL